VYIFTSYSGSWCTSALYIEEYGVHIHFIFRLMVYICTSCCINSWYIACPVLLIEIHGILSVQHVKTHRVLSVLCVTTHGISSVPCFVLRFLVHCSVLCVETYSVSPTVC
jgi:hypothetical protein